MSGYVMESEQETRRLEAQARALPVRAHLRATGLTRGMAVLDAGCGPGLITALLAEEVGSAGSVVGLDLNAQRLGEARGHCAAMPWCRFLEADVRRTGLPDGAFDYVWSQYLFEYLPDPEAALAELVRVTRLGGRVVVSDVDGVGMFNWPCPPELEQDFQRFVTAVATTGYDIHVGRKMFHLFRRVGLSDVRVHLAPLWVVAGEADTRMLEDWRVRFAALEPVAAPAFAGLEGYRSFCDRYLDMLRDPTALKYSVLLITEGRKQ